MGGEASSIRARRARDSGGPIAARLRSLTARTLATLLAALALGAVPALGEPHAHHEAHGAALALGEGAEAALARATRALDRFRDPAAADAAGYRKPFRNDGFEMGEHWYHPQLLADRTCELERPEFLQYLTIDGERQLIGTGYVCDAPAPRFGEAAWHRHGSVLCRTRRGAVMEFQHLAQALPNSRTAVTWQDLCGRLLGKPEERTIAMLHTWNWIPHPDGPLVHEDRAIPHLRAGLAVPERERLDGADGKAARATLRLADGDLRWRWRGAFLVAGVGWRACWQASELDDAEAAARAAIARMRDAEAAEDAAAWSRAARAGADAGDALQRDVEALLSAEERAIAQPFLASLVVHDAM